MKITCISDIHGYEPNLISGDLLIVAGDLTRNDNRYQHIRCRDWIEEQEYEKVIVIAGNHDGFLQKDPNFYSTDKITYLQDSGIEFEGYFFWGSPWTPEFLEWHFMLPRGKKMKEKWDLIPKDVDVLITHGPPQGILDKEIGGEQCGCEELYEKFYQGKLKPQFHIFGHIHEGYGRAKLMDIPDTEFINCAIMNEHYRPRNKPIEIDL